MPIEVVEFTDDHLQAAAALVAARYGVEIEQEPLLSRRYQHTAETLPFLRRLRSRGPGVAALEDGRLVGFIQGSVSMFKGVQTAYVPDSGHGTDTQNSRNVYRDMYAQLAARWVASGCFVHNISIMAHHRQAMDAFHTLGFGMINIDAIRDFSPGPDSPDGVEIRRAGLRDLDAVVSLETKLGRHLASSAAFLPMLPDPGRRRSVEEQLSNSDEPTWVARYEGATVGFVAIESTGRGPVLARSDDGIMSLVGAFVEPETRSLGVGRALVNIALEWGRSAEYGVCVVDFESANIEGTRFWLGAGFRPVIYSLSRRLDDRIAWATE